MNLTPRASLYAVSAGVLVAGGALFVRWWRQRPWRDPLEIERKRFEYVNRTGRLTQGEILDVIEGENGTPLAVAPEVPAGVRVPAASGSRAGLLVYRYTVAGVDYQTAQELSWLPNEFEVPAPGSSVSVKYDPANPSNSILMAEVKPGPGERGPRLPTPGKDNRR